MKTRFCSGAAHSGNKLLCCKTISLRVKGWRHHMAFLFLWLLNSASTFCYKTANPINAFATYIIKKWSKESTKYIDIYIYYSINIKEYYFVDSVVIIILYTKIRIKLCNRKYIKYWSCTILCFTWNILKFRFTK